MNIQTPRNSSPSPNVVVHSQGSPLVSQITIEVDRSQPLFVQESCELFCKEEKLTPEQEKHNYEEWLNYVKFTTQVKHLPYVTAVNGSEVGEEIPWRDATSQELPVLVYSNSPQQPQTLSPASNSLYSDVPQEPQSVLMPPASNSLLNPPFSNVPQQPQTVLVPPASSSVLNTVFSNVPEKPQADFVPTESNSVSTSLYSDVPQQPQAILMPPTSSCAATSVYSNISQQPQTIFIPPASSSVSTSGYSNVSQQAQTFVFPSMSSSVANSVYSNGSQQSQSILVSSASSSMPNSTFLFQIPSNIPVSLNSIDTNTNPMSPIMKISSPVGSECVSIYIMCLSYYLCSTTIVLLKV